MLPPLNQIPAERTSSLGPPREAVQRPTAPTVCPLSVTPPFRSANAARRLSTAKPPSASATAATYASPRRATAYRPSVSPLSTSYAPQPQPQALAPGATTAIETLSRIPREFFVVETNAVLPQTQYPPSQYQSTFVGAGAWETIVFPALTPHTRQQVLSLRHALETMQSRLAAEGTRNAAAVPALAAEYTEKEWALHSVCFHELARQIKFICREQSELLFEIQSAYAASIARLASLVRQLTQQRDADQLWVTRLQDDQLKAKEETEQRRQQAEDEDKTNSGKSSGGTSICGCGRSERTGSSTPWRRSKHRNDRYGDDHDDETQDDNDDDDDDGTAWRAFQRHRRLRRKQFANDDDDDDNASDDDDSDLDDGGRGRLQRASIVEENTAAARVQQAFIKYQQRKDAHRTIQRQEKRDAALDIQRSYRGYRERKRALHHRAVVSTILKRRKQVAAVELLQMNVRAYLIKMRREHKHGGSRSREEPATAHTSMMEAQRAAAMAALASTPTTTGDLLSTNQDAQSTSGKDQSDSEPTTPDAEAAATSDRFAQLLNGMSELAVAFSFLHSRRRNAKRMKPTVEKSVAKMEAEPAAVALVVTDKVSDTVDSSSRLVASSPSESQATQADDAAAERDLLASTIRRAEHLMHSFRSVIHDLRRDDVLADDGLTKATSTTSLLLSTENDSDSRVANITSSAPCSAKDALGSAAFLFLNDDDDVDTTGGYSQRNKLPPSPSPRRHAAGEESKDGGSLLNDDDDDSDDSDATHLDDVLWHASAYSPRSSDEHQDEASARQLLLRELLASRDQQKRHAALKQFIVDIYDTIVGRLSELPRARLQKLIQVHASLALSLADGQRLLRRRRATATTLATVSPSEYEPVRAFVGPLDLKTLIHDHFHCHVGLPQLVDAATQRVETDLRHFMGMDPDVHRFYEYLTRERSLADLVFFCLCRLFARDTSQSLTSSSSSRQPVFHCATLREIVDVTSAMAIATRLFHACGDDASMARTDAFVVEPTNEIYTRHLPSSGLQQVQVILRDYVSPVDVDSDPGLEPLRQDQHLRATNANQLHAREYNASAARSPLRQRPTQMHAASASSSSSQWMCFTEVVELLRRYRSATRHFHAFVHWTHERFHDAFRQQRQQQLLDVKLVATSSGTPLLEEAAFVETLLPYSLGASDRELRNVFHNALRQRQLQRLMPVRVFVSVVLVLLRNGLLSVTSYRPLQRPPVLAANRSNPSDADASGLGLGLHRRGREEKQWLQLALQWRSQEQRFEATVERLYADPSSGGDDQAATASRLLQWRNELYALFMHRSGRESLERAQTLCKLLLQGVARHEGDGDGEEEEEEEGVTTTSVPETEDDGKSPRRDYDGGAAAVGSPWRTTRETDLARHEN